MDLIIKNKFTWILCDISNSIFLMPFDFEILFFEAKKLSKKKSQIRFTSKWDFL